MYKLMYFSNDAAAHVHEILEYHKTIDVVRAFIDKNPNVVMISVGIYNPHIMFIELTSLTIGVRS
jgi:hypothetical protein